MPRKTMAFPRDDGVPLILPKAAEKAEMDAKKRRPTSIPIFQGLVSTNPARKLHDMKLAARQAGQGMDKAQKVFLDIS